VPVYLPTLYSLGPRTIGAAVFLGLWLTSAASGLSTNNPPATARVILVQDSSATQTFSPRPAKIQAMVNRGLLRLTGKPDVNSAWRSLVTTQDVVGIKVFSTPGTTSGTRPSVVSAVVEGLLAAGVPARQIVIWDKNLADLQQAKFDKLASKYGVRLAGSVAAGYDEKVFYDNPLVGSLIWSDLEFGRKGESIGRHSFVTKLLTQDITKIINVTPLLNHNYAGVTGNLYGLAMASVDNTARFEGSPQRLARAVPEICALPAVGDRVVLNIVDALVCQYEGGPTGLLHYSVPLNQLRLSTDPVALDLLSIHELDRLRRSARDPAAKVNLELYRNATLLELGISQTNRIRLEEIR